MAALTDPRAIAYHEAGHTIARMAAGNPVTHVAIAMDGSGGGNTRYLRRPWGYSAPLTDAMCALAGPIAEALATDRTLAEVLAENGVDERMARDALREDAARTDLRTAARMATGMLVANFELLDEIAAALLSGPLDEIALAKFAARVIAW